jgi:hypothetical protein
MAFIGYGLHGAGETRSTRTTGARVDRAGLRDTEGGQRRSAALRCTAARPGLAVHGHGKVAVRAHYWALGPVDHGPSVSASKIHRGFIYFGVYYTVSC